MGGMQRAGPDDQERQAEAGQRSVLRAKAGDYEEVQNQTGQGPDCER